MNLVMFDIDGTLTQTFAVDSDCFVQAVLEVSELSAISTDWASYQHTSDSGILDEIFQTRLKRPPSEDEIRAVRELFIRKLRQASSVSSTAFARVSGAQEFIEWLLACGHAVALASGGWKDSALLKLAMAELKLEGMPAAFADDAAARAEIMSCSYRRACAAHGVAEFADVIYVGDGVWDAKASRSLNYKFVGVAAGDRAKRLTEWGAVATLRDYSDITTALEKIAFAFGR
jgi:phosphoglycolate phosphatase-like HAD superfamily hydrolase